MIKKIFLFLLTIFNLLQSVEIRKATTEDYLAIAEIHHASWHSTFDSMLPEVYSKQQTKEYLNEYWHRYFSKKKFNQIILVALKDKKIIGFIAAGEIENPSEIMKEYKTEIHKLYVSNKELGKRVGAILLKNCLNELFKKGFDKIIVRVFFKNTKAQKFYEKQGGIFLGEEEFSDYHGVLKAKIYGYNINKLQVLKIK